MENIGTQGFSFDLPKGNSSIIKVIGVGGGGNNALKHMYEKGIHGVDFVICNTDAQTLDNNPVSNKVQLGVTITEGLGAGADPEVGEKAAIESIEDIKAAMGQNTKMVFITAGMGGGTGTGAAPVIAQLAKERDILTVGIVTLPFLFEGKVRQEQAIIGIEKLRKQVDSLIVINNNKLREVYGNLGFKAGFSKADEVLATASRGIAEVITHHYTQNIDLRDAKTVLYNSGTAIMGSATALGENRAKEAIIAALDSPLLNDNKITGAKNVLLLIVSGTNEITIDEIGEINDHIQNEAGNNANIIMGVGEDETLGDAISVTIIATGFDVEQQNEIVNTEPKKIIHTLEEEQRSVHNLINTPVTTFNLNDSPSDVTAERVVFELEEEIEEEAPVVLEVKKPVMNNDELIVMSEFIKNLDVTFEIVSPIEDFDFNISLPSKEEVQLPQANIIEEQKQTAFSFDLPVTPKPTFVAPSAPVVEEKIVFDLSNEAHNINVVQPIQFVPVTELTDNGIIKYSLEEYMEVENDFVQSKPQVKQEEVPAELNITMKQVAPIEVNEVAAESVSPMDMTIEETLRFRAEERRKKLKEFNYKFHNNVTKIDELEREPAYKRLGVDLTNQATSQNSRISVSTDSNNDLQFRSNNSYLHDNVD